MLENESLEFQPEGEPIRHIRRVESFGFFYGRSSENIVGNIVDRSANTERCTCEHMPVVEIGAVAVDGADIKAEIEFRLLLRELQPLLPCRLLRPRLVKRLLLRERIGLGGRDG